MPAIFKKGRGKVLVHEGYIYSCNKKSHMFYWKCRSDGCSAKLTTEPFDLDNMDADITVIRSENHQHPVQQEKLDTVAARNEMIDIIKNNPAMPTKRVYDEVTTIKYFLWTEFSSLKPFVLGLKRS